MIPSLSALNPADENVPFTFDFSKVLEAEETIGSVVSVKAVPDTITVGGGTVIDGDRDGCAVQFTLGLGSTGQIYTVTAEILTSNGVRLARSAFVPVNGI